MFFFKFDNYLVFKKLVYVLIIKVIESLVYFLFRFIVIGNMMRYKGCDVFFNILWLKIFLIYFIKNSIWFILFIILLWS